MSNTTTTPARLDPEVSRERSEAMDAALDITATTTTLKAKEAFRVASKARKETKTALDKAHAEFKDALYERACKTAYKLPVVAAVQQLAKVLARVELTPEEVFADIRVFNYNTAILTLSQKNEDDTFTVDAYPVVDIDFRRTEENKQTHYEGDKVRFEFSIAAFADLKKLWANWSDADAADIKALKAVEDAQHSLDSIPDQVDIARVQLQKVKLESMGDNGKEVLARITSLLETSNSTKSIDML